MQIARGLDWQRFHGEAFRKNVGKKCVFDGCEIERLNCSPYCYLHGEVPNKTARVQQVYFMLAEEINEFKVGTSLDVGRRFEEIQAQVEARIVLISMIAGGYSLEAQIHKAIQEYRTHGEWFERKGNAEKLLEVAARKGRQGVEAFLVLYGD